MPAMRETHAAARRMMEAFVPPKPKEFERTVANFRGSRLVGDNVKLNSGIGFAEVDVRRQKLFAQREQTDDGFDRAGRA